ncbi:hypothetical protein RO3G_14555 [Rhizopus delemar RA 99-880]|uniref:Transposase Tc1-like domain-containing protein n=1 Tax=Rhizopus delemar (strain RA 99-880 / ATCC MYA-4621 / FGSC 9543 / NRRL 43880) TaxID=246409 RepID=I1CN14_RHIO9|nr:hypothetical protein RO3G_14555 [Rhizopus delemar RA 99-880]|eukprot:EIE89844.1 hypothetical protein RO3G_14555 [Rhizopus delemar RA 99-880]
MPKKLPSDIQNILHSVEIYAETKKKKPLLTEKHKKARSAWAKKHQYWTPHHIDVTVKHGDGGLMLWGCIASEGPGYACQIYNGTMNSEVYQKILGTSLKDTMEYYGRSWKMSVF